ncbi:2-dehydro-3-deoxyphosphogluconate aldolase / (4S)-4-hydroxy-2-oxoglutarate aldolase [Roseovarius pacificus]|uniref:2-dehydro-3-deoxy-phosphogluconate aldolase n=1 Tax=Roseovarius pacificus TaxID=337701 RepID=A0A1M6WHS3_9RHOB|nr:bifunctional 4-hydroxy-2-oxoglutarate aldolase/2-dehydro-3-deoxy-phosphogluconate aldolase [Roseovarius pacificus]GGO53322.1 ketohydroxyglutarate aldolase [Roseovarius pacificus]SHK93189.1 2-dehydro-3-deoxyphosphogluconate aldolase / (4S)-4-hydroxy-2-oxoglutarate aldolase [Roseovarius pacificus]
MTPQEISRRTRALCTLVPVIPVLVIDDPATAAPLARALVAGGLPVLEVTLRTPAALDAMAQMAQVEGAIVGAGTVLTAEDVKACKTAGASFAVSPGSTPNLLDACEAAALPVLPGAATATEVMTLLERGYDMLKFFPAEASGGVPALKAIGAPLPQVSFCPTGGITPDSAPSYLALRNTLCVGGSWVAPPDAILAKDWDRITELARAASRIPRAQT